MAQSKRARLYDLRTGRRLSRKQIIARLSKKKPPKIRLFSAGGIKVIKKDRLLRLLKSSAGAQPAIGTLNAPFKLTPAGR
jgi:hypothetical protein